MSAALKTIDDYIAEARILLQDVIAPYRYDDNSLVSAMNITLLEGRRVRPDLFIYRRERDGPIVQTIQAKDGTEIKMEEQFRLAFLHGMCAHALLRDQEDIEQSRSAVFATAFHAILTGATPPAKGP